VIEHSHFILFCRLILLTFYDIWYGTFLSADGLLRYRCVANSAVAEHTFSLPARCRCHLEHYATVTFWARCVRPGTHLFILAVPFCSPRDCYDAGVLRHLPTYAFPFCFVVRISFCWLFCSCSLGTFMVMPVYSSLPGGHYPNIAITI